MLILLLIGSRLAVVLRSSFAYYEEEPKWTALGVDLLDSGGLLGPLIAYLDSPHSGGGLIVSVLSAGFQAALPWTLLAHKLLAIGCAAGLAWTVARLLTRFHSRTAATAFLLLFIASPPAFTLRTVCVIGNITPQALMVALGLWSLLALVRSVPQNRSRRAFVFGLTLGFGPVVHGGMVGFSGLLVLAAVALVPGRALARATLPGLLGGAIGILPVAWLWFGVGYADRGGVATRLSSLQPGAVLERVTSLVFLDLPRSFHFSSLPFVDNRTLSYLYLLSLVSALLLLIVGRTARAKPPSSHGAGAGTPLPTTRWGHARALETAIMIVWCGGLLLVASSGTETGRPGRGFQERYAVVDGYYLNAFTPWGVAILAMAWTRVWRRLSKRPWLGGAVGALGAGLIALLVGANLVLLDRGDVDPRLLERGRSPAMPAFETGQHLWTNGRLGALVFTDVGRKGRAHGGFLQAELLCGWLEATHRPRGVDPITLPPSPSAGLSQIQRGLVGRLAARWRTHLARCLPQTQVQFLGEALGCPTNGRCSTCRRSIRRAAVGQIKLIRRACEDLGAQHRRCRAVGRTLLERLIARGAATCGSGRGSFRGSLRRR